MSATKTKTTKQRVAEPRTKYEVGYRLGLLQGRIQQLVDEAETLLGVLDEMDRVISNARWRARNLNEREPNACK